MRKTNKKLRKGNRLRLCYKNSELSGSSCILGWTGYNNGKMFCLWCCEYGNLSNASFSFVTGGCTNLKIDTLRSHDISTGHNNVVKVYCALKHPAVQPLLYLNCILDNYLSCSSTWPVQHAFCPVKI